MKIDDMIQAMGDLEADTNLSSGLLTALLSERGSEEICMSMARANFNVYNSFITFAFLNINSTSEKKYTKPACRHKHQR
jgi:hypothetical protein